MKRLFFITGTDTGVGKTVLTALLAASLRERGICVAALKPVCSGGRDDARILRDALGGSLALDEINPWHFRAPIAPVLAARQEQRRVRLKAVLGHINAMRKDFGVVLIEGAGGLLSPLGENFDSRDLISALSATPLIVAPNRLGAINQILLTLEALPKILRARAGVVLMTPQKTDAATAANADLLGGKSVQNIFRLPWFEAGFTPAAARQNRSLPRAGGVLAELIRWIGAPTETSPANQTATISKDVHLDVRRRNRILRRFK